MINRFMLVGSVLLAVSVAVIAQETADSLTQQVIKQLNKAVDVLGTIKDKKSAMEATPRLRDIAKTMGDLKKKADKLKPSKEEQEVLERKYKKELDAIVRKIVAETARLQKVEGAAEALKELDNVK